MSLFISPNNEYPRHIGDIQLLNPNWNPGQDLPEGWTSVEYTEAPETSGIAIAFEVFPKEIDGVWYQSWDTRDLTQQELDAIELNKVRAKVSNGESLTEAEAALLVR